nr:S24 family peptidase [uncultured Cohaesibacter sp.]
MPNAKDALYTKEACRQWFDRIKRDLGIPPTKLATYIGVTPSTINMPLRPSNDNVVSLKTLKAVGEFLIDYAVMHDKAEIVNPILADTQPLFGFAITPARERFTREQHLQPTTTTIDARGPKHNSSREIVAGFAANQTQQRGPKDEHRTDIPVYGTAAGSIVGSMQLEEGRQVSFVERPRGLRSSARAYALIVTGSSMSPKFEEGDLVFVDPDRKVNAGDTIIIQTQNFNKNYDEPTRAYIKTFRGVMDNILYTEQLNPPAKLDFPMKGKKDGAELVYSYDRVLTTRELFDA